jgi:hypothetical protein
MPFPPPRRSPPAQRPATPFATEPASACPSPSGDTRASVGRSPRSTGSIPHLTPPAGAAPDTAYPPANRTPPRFGSAASPPAHNRAPDARPGRRAEQIQMPFQRLALCARSILHASQYQASHSDVSSHHLPPLAISLPEQRPSPRHSFSACRLKKPRGESQVHPTARS